MTSNTIARACLNRRRRTIESLGDLELSTARAGLSWPTLCKCDLIHMVVKTELKQRRGLVSAERRRAIVTTINRSNEWM